jgi:CheY-like chemotaxis protein
VDDNWDVAESTVEWLRLVGFEAVACYDGPHALAVAPAFRPDVCLIDFNLPHMDGDELLGHLRALLAGSAVLFVAVTARGDDEARRRTTAAGFAVHLVKPVEPRDLLRLIDELWRRAEAARRAEVVAVGLV